MRLPFKPPTFAFYQRLTARERVLLLIVVGSALFIANLVLLSTLFRSSRELSLEYTAKAQDYDRELVFAEQKAALWMPRNEWLKKTQPALANRSVEGSRLLEVVQGIARSNAVIITNPKFLDPVGAATGSAAGARADYQAVSLHVDTQSDWRGVIKFLAALQKPEAFLVLENASLRTEQSDPAKMRGEFLISKWYAPAVGK